MGLAACSGGDQHHGTTRVAPAASNDLQDAGELQPSMKEDFCVLDADSLEDHKSCTVDADCMPLTYRPTCCANTLVIGVSQDSAAELQACIDKAVPVCTCEATPNRADDGRAVRAGTQVRVQCDAGRCVSGVSERTCGNKLTCKPGEICVSYGDALNGAPPDASTSENAYIAFACLPNPCSGRLDCECAKSVCDARGVGTRKCETARTDETDVACVPYHD